MATITQQSSSVKSSGQILQTLSDLSIRFTLLSAPDHPARSKTPLYHNWQHRPFDLQAAIEHLRKSGNVGALPGVVSWIDIDGLPDALNFPAFITQYPQFANALRIIRRDALHKGKLAFVIDGPLPRSQKYHLNANPKPAYELFTTTGQVVVAGRHETTGALLEMEGSEVPHVTTDELDAIIYELTGKHLEFDDTQLDAQVKQQAAKQAAPAVPQVVSPDNILHKRIRGGVKRLVVLVKEYWTPERVMAHFSKAGKTKHEHNARGLDTRMLDNGGTLISGTQWWCFSAPNAPGKTGNGGDCIDAWCFYKYDRMLSHRDPLFLPILLEMADLAHIPVTLEDDAMRRQTQETVERAWQIVARHDAWKDYHGNKEAGMRAAVAIIQLYLEYMTLSLPVSCRELAKRANFGSSDGSSNALWHLCALGLIEMVKDTNGIDAKEYRLTVDKWQDGYGTHQSAGTTCSISNFHTDYDIAFIRDNLHNEAFMSGRYNKPARVLPDQGKYKDGQTGETVLGKPCLLIMAALSAAKGHVSIKRLAELAFCSLNKALEIVTSLALLDTVTIQTTDGEVYACLLEHWQEALDKVKQDLTTLGCVGRRVKRFLEEQISRLTFWLSFKRPTYEVDRLEKRKLGMEMKLSVP